MKKQPMDREKYLQTMYPMNRQYPKNIKELIQLNSEKSWTIWSKKKKRSKALLGCTCRPASFAGKQGHLTADPAMTHFTERPPLSPSLQTDFPLLRLELKWKMFNRRNTRETWSLSRIQAMAALWDHTAPTWGLCPGQPLQSPQLMPSTGEVD